MLGKIRIFLSGIIIIPAIILSLVTIILPVMLTRILFLKRLSNWILLWGSVILCDIILVTLGVKVKVEGKENLPSRDTASCYMANHLSILDVVIIQGKLKLRTGYIGKAELKKIPVLNLWFFANKSIFLNRKSPRYSIKAILDGVNKLKNGWSMTVFPEGTRNKQDSVSSFKHGTLKLATRSETPIVPICIVNTQYAIEKRKTWRARKVTVSVLEKVETKNLSEEEIQGLNTVIRDKIFEEYQDKYANTKPAIT